MLISKSKECNICHYWYFLNRVIKFQSYVCNRCHDLLMMSMYLSDIAILIIKSADFCCIISGISKNEAINLMQTTKTQKFKRLVILKLKKINFTSQKL